MTFARVADCPSSLPDARDHLVVSKSIGSKILGFLDEVGLVD